ncbi:zinc finger protein 271-like [Macrobrachium rosenbergii]|uniref:zinc finger protein 271-like n=1 Tax=Macrobrachium rosenbergii TaxID=79674 RepID=UPI0034D7AC47
MALEKGSGPQPIAQVKMEPEHVEEQVYYEQSDWENSYAEGTVVSDNHETPDIYVDESSYMYHDSQMEYETVIVPAYQIRTHTGKRPYVCESCNMTVMPNNRPWNHIRVLGGGQPIVRHVYYMNFTRKSVCTPSKAQSDKPKKVGKGKRTYPCDKCERVFGHKSHLDNHLRTHSGEKPFVCLYCDKRFGQKSNLTSHMRRHPLHCSKKIKSYPKIKEEPIEEDCFEVDSSEDISKNTPLSQVPQDKNVHSAVVQSADVSQEMRLSTENMSTCEVLTKDTSQEEVSSSLVYEEKDPSNMPSTEVDSCVVAATEVVRSQPHSEEVISSVTITKKENQVHDKSHNSSSPSQVNKELTRSSTAKESSSPAHLKAETNSQGKTENVISSIIAPKKVLFQIRSQVGSNAHPKQSLSQAESHDVTSSISGNKKKVIVHEKSFKIKTKSVVSADNDSSQDKLSRVNSASQDMEADKEQNTKTSTSEIVPVIQLKTEKGKLETDQADHKHCSPKSEKS